MKKLNKRGFTLVEALGVLVIISILATLVIPKIIEYMQEGKRDYNDKLSGQLLLAGKAYYADNKIELPTTETAQKYNYVTVPTMESNNYITEKIVDSDGNDCSASYVHVRQKGANSNKYIYTPCLICEDEKGNITNHNEANLYCTVANFADDSPPTCDMIDADYDSGEEIVLKNVADKLGKGSNTPGRIKAILISSDLSPVLSEGFYLDNDISFSVIDEEVQIDVEEKSVDEIMGMSLRGVIEKAYKPTERGGNYDIQIMDTSLNISKTCISIALSDNDKHITEKDSNTCNLTIKNNTMTINKLVTDNEIKNIYYINPSDGTKVSLFSELSSKIKHNTAEHKEGYPIGSYYIDKDTIVANIPTKTELVYINDNPRNTDSNYEPIKCKIKNQDTATSECEGNIVDNKLTITKAKDESGVKDIYYVSGSIQKSILPEESKGMQNIEQIIEQNVPKDAIVKIVNMDDIISTCNITDMPNTKISNKSGYPHCTITRKDNNEYLNVENKTARFEINCDEKENSTLTIANSIENYIITNNLKGKITIGTITGNNTTNVKIPVSYEAYNNVSGNDYLRILPGMITATSTGNTNEKFNSEIFMVDTIPPTIVYTISSVESVLAGVNTYLTPFRINIECLDTGSDVDYLRINDVNRSNPKIMSVTNATATPQNYTYKSSCKDNAGNGSNKQETYKIAKAPQSNCKFDAISSTYIKKGGSMTIKATCAVPGGTDTLNVINKNNFVATSNKGTLSITAAGAGTSTVTFNVKYSVKDNQIGADYVRMNSGVVETANHIKNNQVTSGKLNVDSKIPVVSFNKSNGTYNANDNGAFKYTVSCTDQGSGVKSIVVDGKTYNVTSKTFSIKKAVKNGKHTAYCIDKAGNNSTTVTRTYSVKIYGRNESCGVEHYKTCRDSKCSCAKYNSCSKCSCKKWNYKTVCTYKWKCKGKGSSSYQWSTSCSNPGSTFYNSGAQCKCQKYGCSSVKSSCNTYNSCNKCSCKTRNKCEAKGCGVKSYKQCWHL